MTFDGLVCLSVCPLAGSVETGRRRPLRDGHLHPGGEGVRRHDGEDGLEAGPVHHLGDLLQVAPHQQDPRVRQERRPQHAHRAGRDEVPCG